MVTIEVKSTTENTRDVGYGIWFSFGIVPESFCDHEENECHFTQKLLTSFIVETPML
jgi:hypothetical protein